MAPLKSLLLAGPNLLIPPNPGWTIATLTNDSQIKLGEHCHDSAISDLEDLGIDCTLYRKRLAVWVKTGTMPQE